MHSGAVILCQFAISRNGRSHHLLTGSLSRPSSDISLNLLPSSIGPTVTSGGVPFHSFVSHQVNSSKQRLMCVHHEFLPIYHGSLRRPTMRFIVS
ncbi:hypothetical protein LX32DRAFT_296439 [Colletotrichum zoysiae]|uniref:Uncharacterized protein n=1 Tax=Colletotrichum zoysiae TaxID=1216348 RepID=A0AAD9HKU8_9PEZI|nr:hypothetical protein LX32DRAFT_296439 [Colletotrichum zoysiae]